MVSDAPLTASPILFPLRTTTLGRAFLACGAYALACVGGILLAEAKQWPEAFWHLTQLLAVLGCLVAAALYLVAAKRDRLRDRPVDDRMIWLARAAVAATGAWLLFWAAVLLLLSASADDS